MIELLFVITALSLVRLNVVPGHVLFITIGVAISSLLELLFRQQLLSLSHTLLKILINLHTYFTSRAVTKANIVYKIAKTKKSKLALYNSTYGDLVAVYLNHPMQKTKKKKTLTQSLLYASK